ncbi:MAG TPA: ABC transporter ATP-binding protein [Desulfobacteraceae bacterium]|nr:ABC transporter ATP-binding protein [Desulfobacteraceae bacterium]HPJ66821.1 ABC transporter ATP-binding protein [Desulfobacteraceae bacterium]HPQ27031.1 ABC transporter ATP-binding protein [Desulfobacteraceae bacterium]
MLQLKDIDVKYGQAEAVKGVSINVEEGEFISIIGSNGAGKSTILRTVSGLKRANSGEIWFEGKRIDKLSTVEIVRAGLIHVPQGRHIFPYMTVMDNILMGAFLESNKAEINNRLNQVFSYFPILKNRKEQRAGSLSGGEQQMLVMGRSLMLKPKLLLIDEPSLGLSPIVVKQIFSIVENIFESGISILLVEQNVRLAFKVSQRSYVLETGRIVLKGDSKDLEADERIRTAYLGG